MPKFGSRRYVFFFLSKCVISIEYLLMMYKYSTLFYVCSNMSSELSECGESASGPQLCSSDSCRVQEFQQGYDAEEVGSGVEGGVQGSTKEWTEEFGHKISQLRGDIICGVKNKEKAEERIAESGAMKQLPVEFLQVEEAEKLKVYSDAGNLVLVLGTSNAEEDFFISELDSMGVSPLPRVLSSEFGVNDR